MSKAKTKVDNSQAIKNIEAQKSDFVNMVNDLSSKAQTEETRDKIWELKEIINSLDEDAKALKDADISI